MIKHIEHLGIAVDNLKKANDVFTKLLNKKPYKKEAVASEHVTTSFFEVGQTKIELLEDGAGKGAIAKFIEKRGGGLHHLAIEVDDIRKEMNRLREAGFVLLNDEPKEGADNKLICFLHPKTTCGVLVELCQER